MNENVPVQFDAVEKAISAFESIHSLNITVHDLSGILSPFIQAHRFHHRSRHCLAVKAQGQESTCVHFEISSLRPELSNIPDGRIHVCPAGFVEWVVPVFHQQELALVLFAGIRLPGKTLVSAIRTAPIKWDKSLRNKHRQKINVIGEKEAQLILEHLRQLAARLQLWLENFYSVKKKTKSPDAFSANSLIKRKLIVYRFIEENYQEHLTVKMLAQHLHLSESRTSHAVRQSCGVSFRSLLIQRRLCAAMELLRDSGMSILQIALSTGFSDITHFHRLFRKKVGTTPAKYRIIGQS
ncbi:MAG: AraC family transcriptional regulator [Kiritimatiellales bacterium]